MLTVEQRLVFLMRVSERKEDFKIFPGTRARGRGFGSPKAQLSNSGRAGRVQQPSHNYVATGYGSVTNRVLTARPPRVVAPEWGEAVAPRSALASR